ncbi:MAG: hypothetical protein E4H21_02705 [Thermodesulfobacteriales bacterium]|nr:MAG: hypothetical protein E4H21_02705 [Thermodesulfobacteriales bacterium]
MKATKLLFTVMSSLIVICSLISAQSIASEKGSNVINLNKNGLDGSKLAMASAPPLYELELTSLSGEIFINPKYTGKINSVRLLNRNELLGEKVEIETRTLTDNWKKLIIPPSLSEAFGLIISGKEGIIKITLPQNSSSISGSGTLKSISDLFIEFGALRATFTFPALNVLEPSKFEIGILDTVNNTFINGDIIALKSNQAAVKFENLPSSVVNSEGLIRISLRKSDGTFINSDIPTWGYNILVSETDTGVAAPITAEVFGLPDDSEIKFNFTSLSGQIINPSTKTLTVGEINKGEQVSTITTKIEGPQPIAVTVRRLN